VPDAPSEADILDVLCQPGFSTRENADRAAGRGVGMAVVGTTVHELGGTVGLATVPGAWTQFTLTLPLTLSIAESVIVSAGAQTCAVPQSFISEIVQFEERDVHTVKQVEVIPYRDGVLPIVRLGTLFHAAPATRERVPVLVIASERGSAGLVVDRVHAQREIVVRPVSDPLLRVPGVAGATELGDGRPILILDPAALTAGPVRPLASQALAGAKTRPAHS
jgi:two-component system, chemotaxis family, sensor kinase CheA